MITNLKDQRPKTKELRLRIESGFTLIELSIVIVIIGLIVSGVVGGQALVKQAKIRGLISDIVQYELAINTFKLEYGSLPGDLRNASAYGIGNNGNGDRQITQLNEGAIAETTCFAAHLSNAGLIKGEYECWNNGFDIGRNLPILGYQSDVTFWPNYGGTRKAFANQAFCEYCTYNSGLYQKHIGNFINVGRADSSSGIGRMLRGFLTVKESESLDRKMDDGEAGEGKVLIARGWYETAGTCADKAFNQALPVALNYNDTGKTCRLFYKISN